MKITPSAIYKTVDDILRKESLSRWNMEQEKSNIEIQKKQIISDYSDLTVLGIGATLQQLMSNEKFLYNFQYNTQFMNIKIQIIDKYIENIESTFEHIKKDKENLLQMCCQYIRKILEDIEDFDKTTKYEDKGYLVQGVKLTMPKIYEHSVEETVNNHINTLVNDVSQLKIEGSVKKR
ncbi:hypothetical protein CLHOM_19130 [Clostridium homopropionicum DSM 5847]|uniref:Uncharacterized protein n=1 Tax=Clostridium homopropionicum DSM 5847 TaxID=1121318 RepID=A0A0L6ZA26_9CLOT|nr:hypothetical protein [Clostridium homopropionicum]KOA19824.1 hypothetical protein CLHOM_19130 [Clostridium homopropionicum DSM 5847]SFF76642.1 hypothetical protein SAMN04488501_10280 [Clostridium homopropionicum]